MGQEPPLPLLVIDCCYSGAFWRNCVTAWPSSTEFTARVLSNMATRRWPACKHGSCIHM